MTHRLLAECLTNDRYSINIFQINEQMQAFFIPKMGDNNPHLTRLQLGMNKTRQGKPAPPPPPPPTPGLANFLHRARIWDCYLRGRHQGAAQDQLTLAVLNPCQRELEERDPPAAPGRDGLGTLKRHLPSLRAQTARRTLTGQIHIHHSFLHQTLMESQSSEPSGETVSERAIKVITLIKVIKANKRVL